MAFLLVISSLLIAIFSYYCVVWTYWKRRGIAGPTGYPFFGNALDLLRGKYPGFLQIQKWTKKYGGYYGITEGLSKTLVISDPNLVNEVFVKQFDNFYGRKLNGVQGNPNEDENIDLFTAEGYRWKRLRNLSSPTFANNSLKKMNNTVEECTADLLKHIENGIANGESINMLLYYQEFTMDVIGRIAMGQHESQMFRNPLIEPVRAIFSGGKHLIILLGTIMPKAHLLKKIIFALPWLGDPGVVIHHIVGGAVKKRIAQREADLKNGIEPGEPEDFIDLFLDVRADIDIKAESSEEFVRNNGKTNRQLTVDEIISQCALFLLAGYDTTALSLSYATYCMATNPEVMRKVQKEIEEECPDPTVTFDQLTRLKYMECVIREALRMYPLASIANNRRCMKTTKIGDLLIEKDTNIQADSWSLHYDKNVWGEDAVIFRPERWEEPDTKNSFITFGMGPRQCIGMRLAIMEQKLLLTHILRKYDFVPGEKTDVPLKLLDQATITPESLFLHLKPRY